MKAIVLAAGRGRRMAPLSDHIHKALLPIGSSTILGRIVDSLLALGVNDVVVVTGYRGGEVRSFLEVRYPAARFQFVDNPRWAETNNIVSLALALDQIELDGDVLLIECDLLFDAAVLEALVRAPAPNVALVDRWRPGMDGTVVSVEDGVVTQVFPPHLQGERFDYADKFKTLNLYRFDVAFCRDTFRPLLSCYANLIDDNCYYELVLGMVINMQRERVHAEIVEGGRWAEVDDPNDLEAARFAFEEHERRAILERSRGGAWSLDVVDFAHMRNVYFPTDAMLAAMRNALPALVRGYGSTQAVLDDKLALFLLCGPGRVHALHGASQLYPLLPELFPGARSLVPSPTFGEYGRWLERGETYDDNTRIDAAALERRAGAVDLIVVVNPNNPTGTTLPTALLHEMAARHPGARFLVDESFVDFSEEESLLARLERQPLANVLVVKSLGKVLGAPGLRLGFTYTSDEALHARIGARLPIWNLGAPAEFLLELLLKFRAELGESLVRTRSDRAAFAEHLRALAVVESVYEGGGNFLLVTLRPLRAGLATALVDALLARQRIHVKDVSGRFPDGAPRLRVAVRRPDENQHFAQALVQAAADVTA